MPLRGGFASLDSMALWHQEGAPMRSAVTFHCHVCQQSITSTSLYLRITIPGLGSVVRRWCSGHCFALWFRAHPPA
jgi:hypothetical protein